MTAATHAPGPWTIRGPHQDGSAGISDAAGVGIASFSSAVSKPKIENIRIMAAGPDMLEALVECRAEISRINAAAGETRFNPAATALVDAAIAKARGEQ